MDKSRPVEVSHEVVARLIRRDWGRLLAALIHYFRDFDLAEDALQDAVESALTKWPADGIPSRPDAWLLQVARRKALNTLKRSATFERKRAEMVDDQYLNDGGGSQSNDDSTIPVADERLRLMFTCCHPALGLESRVALTLRAIGGLTTPEIARAFIVPESTMAQRLVRSKKKIRKANIPYEIPGPERWKERLDSVMHVVYFVFNEGYAASDGDGLLRADLCDEAVFLGRTLLELAPEEPEVAGLLALMLFHDARRPGRTGEAGELLTLEEQERSLWNEAQIREADSLLKQALGMKQVGLYQLQAAIAGVHAQSPSFEETDWDEILMLYETLCEAHLSSVFRLNRAVALSFASSPVDGLAALNGLEEDLDAYLPFHAARGDFLRRMGRHEEAASAYVRAVRLAGNESERRFFRRRLAGF